MKQKQAVEIVIGDTVVVNSKKWKVTFTVVSGGNVTLFLQRGTVVKERQEYTVLSGEMVEVV